jgi:predicted ferric reductase/mono/diheme cytochrome c family protein
MSRRAMRWMWIVFAMLAAVLLGIAAMSAEPTRLLAGEELSPPGKPSAMRGKEIFEARCASCHGQAGDGSGLEGAANFTDLEFMHQKKPAEFFEAIRNGVGGTAMPAWDDTLSETEIWDVLYYEWTFATSPEEIAQGKELFATNCTTCHGAAGDGSGLEGAANFTDQAFMSNKEPLRFFESIRDGIEGSAMPAWGDKFSDDEIWSVVNFVWTFAYEDGEKEEAPTPMATEPTLPAEEELFPPGKPSAAHGKEIFEANCTICHGVKSDGSGLEGAANFNDLEFMHQKKPSELFKAIRDGVEGTAMPAWGDVLSEIEIWNVLYYEWTFATSPEQVARGKELFALICATCHGAAGDGSGLPGAANFTDQAFMSNEDPLKLFEAIHDGVAGKSMPPWGDRFSQNEIWALVSFLRTFAYEYDEIEAEIKETPTSIAELSAKPDPALGQRVWMIKPCVGCHGLQAEGKVGPRLAATELSFDQVLLKVRTGGGPMPAFTKEQVSDLELQHIYAWLQSLEPSTAATVTLSTIFYGTIRFLALVGFVLVLFQYVLSSKIKWIEKDIGLDKLFRIHKTCGIIGMIFVLIHPIVLVTSGKIQSYEISQSSVRLAAVSIGVLTLSILCATGSSALLHRRLNLKYETWKYIHKANYIVFPLGFAHSLIMGSDLATEPLRTFWLVLLVVYAAVLTYKLVNRVRVRSHPFKVTEVVQETHDTWSLYFTGKNIDHKPGQFMSVQLVRDGKVSEPHPFTISSSPTWGRLSITVKSVGDFTSTIGDTKTSDHAYVDAPYGAFSFLKHDTRELLFIAGGIGITPFMSMLRYIRDSQLERDIVLMWANKTEQDIVFKDELESMATEMSSLNVVHVLSRQPNWPGEKGRIDVEKLKKYTSPLREPQCFICGPAPMLATMIRTLRELGVPKNRIHYEQFSL